MEELQYNTGRDHLKIREYGRNVQELIQHIKGIEDSEKRNKLATYMANMMAAMNPQQKNNEEFKQKIWNHIYQIADFDIDLEKEFTIDKPISEIEIPHLDYPKTNPKYRHYGKSIELMIQEAIKMEDQEKKAAYTKLILAYMKTAYLNWSKDSVTDETIFSDLELMSEGKLEFDKEQRIYSPGGSNKPNNNHRRNNNNNRRNNNYKKRSNNR